MLRNVPSSTIVFVMIISKTIEFFQGGFMGKVKGRGLKNILLFILYREEI